ncbi:Rho GTPase activation protein, partial [Russula earlei]
REFFFPIEVYISNQAAAALRKPNPRKKPEKRESSRPLSILGEDNQRKVKEKTSWLSLASRPATGDQWRQATCRITEEEEGCVLKVYLEETILFQSVHLHLLLHTDIRPADQSLFFRKDCLGIHCSANQRWSATHSTEPLYFAFPSTEAMNTWTTLLRSYATPEVYGRSRAHLGGTYRMWRQVELTCIQGRNIGVPRTHDSTFSSGTMGDQEGRGDVDAVDLDLFCEVYFNSVLSGRTVVKKSMGSPDWHETFLLSDLPPFEKLAIVVWREKRLQKPFVIGTVYITLANFRRGEHVEGWFPVLISGTTATYTQVGQLRLKLRVDEEVVLPYSKYSKVIDALDQRNYLDWMTDLDAELKIREASSPLILIAIAQDTLLPNVYELADREVDGTSSHHTLFRGNTALTKTIESLIGWYGKSFLEASVGVTIRRICLDGVSIEVDPLRNAKGPKDVERNVDLLVFWCGEIWEQIYSVRQQCPDEMRELFRYIRQLVERRYSKCPNADANSELPRQSVSAFCFLRFIVPAILHPHLFGLASGLPDLPVQRSLTLIAKVIQSLANLNTTVHKEDFMRGVKCFMEEKLQEMLDYILVVSTPRPEEPSQLSSEARNRNRAIRVLDERKLVMPELQKELIPNDRHFLDIPRHLALVASTIVRHSRNATPKDSAVADLYNRCREVERRALYYVSRQTMPRGGGGSSSARPFISSDPNSSPTNSTHSPIDPLQYPSSSKPRSYGSRSRPRTAPSGAMSDPALHTRVESRRSQEFPSSGAGLGTSEEPETEEASQERDDVRRTRRRQVSHARSVSTDSIPIFRDAGAGGVKALEGPIRPQTVERKKGFLRNILHRK